MAPRRHKLVVIAAALLFGLFSSAGQAQPAQVCPRHLRQVLVRPRAGLGRPVWADDAHFGIGQHVCARPVPAPGDEAARSASQTSVRGAVPWEAVITSQRPSQLTDTW